jgi:hypothetical protein
MLPVCNNCAWTGVQPGALHAAAQHRVTCHCGHIGSGEQHLPLHLSYRRKGLGCTWFPQHVHHQDQPSDMQNLTTWQLGPPASAQTLYTCVCLRQCVHPKGCPKGCTEPTSKDATCINSHITPAHQRRCCVHQQPHCTAVHLMQVMVACRCRQPSACTRSCWRSAASTAAHSLSALATGPNFNSPRKIPGPTPPCTSPRSVRPAVQDAWRQPDNQA